MADVAIVPLSAELCDLFGQSAAAEGSYGWFEVLASETLDPGEVAVVAVARDERGTPRAALPLARRGVTLRALTAPYTTRFAPAFPDPAWAGELGRAAQGYVRGVLRLDALAADDPGVAAFLVGLGQAGLAVARYRHFGNWFELVTDFDAYWSKRPSRLKTTARRKLTQSAGAEFACYRGTSELEEGLAAYEDVYSASWKQPEPHPHFMARMVRALGADGLVRIGVLKLASQPVAAQIWLVCAGRATIFKLAHRMDSAERSPGTLLTRWLASVLIEEDRLAEIDLGRGDDTYKRDWLGQSRDRIGLVAARWTSAAGLKAIAKDIVPTRLSALYRSR
jgi:CelD/BcsL family acetyltransferase involved in cellulose biosynthesis